VEAVKQKINKKLENTPLTVEMLEQKYNNDTEFHVVFDMKGNSIWFNASYMEYTGRNETNLMEPNFMNILLALNKDHPMCDVLLNLLQEQPKEFMGKFFEILNVKVESSEITIPNFKKFAFKCVYERIDSTTEGPIGYLSHLSKLVPS
jgi:hypothetical protein